MLSKLKDVFLSSFTDSTHSKGNHDFFFQSFLSDPRNSGKHCWYRTSCSQTSFSAEETGRWSLSSCLRESLQACLLTSQELVLQGSNVVKKPNKTGAEFSTWFERNHLQKGETSCVLLMNLSLNEKRLFDFKMKLLNTVNVPSSNVSPS